MNVNSLSEEKYLSMTMDRLKQQRYKLKDNITYGKQVFKHIAKRTKWESERYGFCTTLFFFSTFANPDIASLKDFSAKAFRYGKKVSWLLPRGLFYGILCFPVAIVDSIDDKTIDFIHRTEPPKHWGAVEKLVVFSLEANMLYYCEATFGLGSWYYDWDRLIIKEMLSPET